MIDYVPRLENKTYWDLMETFRKEWLMRVLTLMVFNYDLTRIDRAIRFTMEK